MRVCTSCKSLLKPDARACPTDGAAAELVERLPKDTRLGAYKIDRMLGEGGMGFVYEATHEVLHRRTAIKLLRPELATEQAVVTRFLNEAKAVNLIDHQNIINVYDYGDGADGSVYFVMEFLEGETLDDLMRKRRPMAMPLLLHVFGQIAKALAAAHGKQIVHRDLKPANVYVVARENNPYFIKLLDFGIAQLRGEGAVKGLTLAGSIMGTPQYMSPEQITGGAVDARSDVWAMGVMLYRAATGHAPFKGDGFAELAGKILQETPVPPGTLVAGLPAALDKLVTSCLERDVQDRCQSISELQLGLERIKKELGLDDAKILAAVRQDAGAISEALPLVTGQATRGSLAGSLPQYQGVPQAPVAPRRSSKLPLVALGGVAIVATAIALYATLGGSGKPHVEPAAAATPAPATEAVKPVMIADKLADRAAVHALAKARLDEAFASANLQQQGQAIDAIAATRSGTGAPLLYGVLHGSPEIRIKAARALGELGQPDAAPKVREALADSGDKVKVELAVVLAKLGDKDALAIVRRATSDPGSRLAAAIALADAGDAKTARPVLDDVVAATPAGRDAWRRAAGALATLGDGKARAALEAELAQPDATRAVASAELLARGGDGKARDYLARVVEDTAFARRGEAAIALARLGDVRALQWVASGFASADPDERKLAIAACALLGDAGARHVPDIAALADRDSDRTVRLYAAAALAVL
ncbi:MAG TPA: protein kinase [Kofleriaceae bacterium]|nr:protein kinase [Kofleriaceae bacterium]